VVDETAGSAITIATRLGFDGSTRLRFFRLIFELARLRDGSWPECSRTWIRVATHFFGV
jgi:hypothetical protein